MADTPMTTLRMSALNETMVSSKLKAVFGVGFLFVRILVSHSTITGHAISESQLQLYICGFVTIFFFGAAFQKRLNVGALVMGCGYRGIGHNDQHTVAVYEYCNDAFPKNQVYKLKILTLTLNRIKFFVGRDQVH